MRQTRRIRKNRKSRKSRRGGGLFWPSPEEQTDKVFKSVFEGDGLVEPILRKSYELKTVLDAIHNKAKTLTPEQKVLLQPAIDTANRLYAEQYYREHE